MHNLPCTGIWVSPKILYIQKCHLFSYSVTELAKAGLGHSGLFLYIPNKAAAYSNNL